MAARTLASTWRQFEKLARPVAGSRRPSARMIQELSQLSERTNRSRIVEALKTLFVEGHPGVDGVSVQFAVGRETLLQPEATSFDAEKRVIVVNPVGVVRFIDRCAECVEEVRKAEAQEDFRSFRLCGLQAELSKLPSHLLFFLAVLRQVADISGVTHSERRPSTAGEPEEDRPYLMLLWAFKQLEAVLREAKGINLRSQYSILWYESDWVSGRR